MPKDINVKITPKPEWLMATEALEKRVKELERQIAEIKQISTYEFGVVNFEWVARKLAKHLKEATSPADGTSVTVGPERQAP